MRLLSPLNISLIRNAAFRIALVVLSVLAISQQVAVRSAQTSDNTPPPTNTPRNLNPGPPPTNTLRSKPTEKSATDMPTVVPTVAATNLPTKPPTKTLLPSKTPLPTKTATNTRTPTLTRTPTPTKTPSRTPTPPPTLVILGTYETPVQPPITAIPLSAPTPVASGDDVVTVLLLGSDTITPGAAGRTDVIILVSINRTRNSVSMLHLPRDLFVYAPNYTMAKINTIMNYGNSKYGPGGGAKLIKETIQYNFGLKIDFYARVDFVNFQNLIAKLGGLDVSVDCAIQGHRLKSPDLDVTKEENYELYTLPVGYQHLNPYMALWYVRSRGSSSDFDRGRRQMDVLRAIWRQAKKAGLLAQINDLWPEAQKIVETDMTIQDILGLIPVAANVDPVDIQRINVDLNTHFVNWFTADTGSYALLPKPDIWKTTIQNFVLPPPKNRLGGEEPSVEVGASLPLKGYENVAADRLSWEGFAAIPIGQEGVVNRSNTVIIDYTGSAKPNSLATLMKVLRVNKSAVIDKPDPNRSVDFRVEMGRDYGSCMWALPPEFQDAPAATTGP